MFAITAHSQFCFVDTLCFKSKCRKREEKKEVVTRYNC